MADTVIVHPVSKHLRAGMLVQTEPTGGDQADDRETRNKRPAAEDDQLDPGTQNKRRRIKELYAQMMVFEAEPEDCLRVVSESEPASSKAILLLRAPRVGETREAHCDVCNDDFEEGDKLRTMPCAHSFHERCIFNLLRLNRLCPICGFKLPTTDELDARASAGRN